MYAAFNVLTENDSAKRKSPLPLRRLVEVQLIAPLSF
jgi:hypothetical protein